MSGSYKSGKSEDRSTKLSSGRVSGQCGGNNDDEDDDDGPCFCQFSESNQKVVTDEDSPDESFDVKDCSSPIKSIDHVSINERMNSTTTSEGTYRTPLLSPDLWDREDAEDAEEMCDDEQSVHYDKSPKKQSEASADRYSSKKSSVKRWSRSPRRSSADNDVVLEDADEIQEERQSVHSEKSSKKQSEASADRYSSRRSSEKRWPQSPRRSTADRGVVVEESADMVEDQRSVHSDKSPKKQSEASADRYSSKRSSVKHWSQTTRRSTGNNRDDVIERNDDDDDVVAASAHVAYPESGTHPSGIQAEPPTSYDHLTAELLISIIESHRDALNDQKIVLIRQTEAINRLAAAVEEQTKIISTLNEKKILHTLD